MGLIRCDLAQLAMMTGATATVTVLFYKDTTARTAHKQPTDFRSYPVVQAETAAIFTSSAVGSHIQSSRGRDLSADQSRPHRPRPSPTTTPPPIIPHS